MESSPDIEWNNVCRNIFFWIQPPPPAQLKAVLHYKDAVQGVHHRRPPLTQAFRRVMYVIHHRTEFFSEFVLFCLICLGFFETPWWCIDNLDCSNTNYPTFLPGKYFISAAHGITFEVVCLVLLALQYSTERVYLGDEFWRGRKGLVRPIWLKTIIVLVYLVELMIGHISNYTTGETLSFRIGPYCRITLLMCTYRPLSAMFSNFISIIPDALEIGVLIVVFILFCTWLGMDMFADDVAKQMYLGTYMDGIWTMMVMLSDNLFPDLLLVTYNHKLSSLIFWVSFMTFGFYVLMNLAFGVLYNAFNFQRREHDERYSTDRERSLEDAFIALATERDGNHEPVVSAEAMSAFLELTSGSKYKDIDVYSMVTYDARRTERVVHGDDGRPPTGSLVASIGRDGGGGTGVAASRGYGALDDEFEHDEHSSLLSGSSRGGVGGQSTDTTGRNVDGRRDPRVSDRTRQIDLAVFKAVTHKLLTERHSIPVKTFMQQWFPQTYRSRTFRYIKYIVGEKVLDLGLCFGGRRVLFFELCVDMVLMMHLFVLLASQTTCSDGIDSSCGWEELDAVISLFYVVECIAKITVHGWHKYWYSSAQNKLDFVVTICVFTSFFIYYALYGMIMNPKRVIKLMVVLRQIRLVRFLHYYDRFRLLTATAQAISMVGGPLLGVAFCYFYAYGFLGMQVFGGYICYESSNVTCLHAVDWDPDTDDYSSKGYWSLNFNDLLGGIVTLFVCTVGNDYNSIVIAYVRATGSKFARIYFAVAYAIGVVIIVNVTVAFVINAYLESWEKEWNRNQKRKARKSRPPDFVSPGATGHHGSYQREDEGFYVMGRRLGVEDRDDDGSTGYYDSGLDSATEDENISLGSEGHHRSQSSSHLLPSSVTTFTDMY